MTQNISPDVAKRRIFARFRAAAPRALEHALTAGLAGYDRRTALARFHRLTPQTIDAETPDGARAVLREIERALRQERASAGHWSYDLNRHIALLTAHRAETARLARISGGRGGAERE